MERLNIRRIVLASVLGLLLSSNGCELAVGPFGDLEDKVQTVFRLNESQYILKIRVTTDESKVVFSSFGTGYSDAPPGLRVYNLTTGEFNLIYETDLVHLPDDFFLSPDGSQILFHDAHDEDYYLVPVEGGEPERLTLAPGTVQSWLDDNNLLMTEVTDGVTDGNTYNISAFIHDFTTGEKTEISNFDVEAQTDWSLYQVKLSVSFDLSVAFFELVYLRISERRKEGILYDLTSGSYKDFPLPERAEAYGPLSPNGSRILSGNRVGSSASDIGYINIADRWYYRVTNSLRQDKAAIWNAKGDRIYFVGTDFEFVDMVFRVDVE